MGLDGFLAFIKKKHPHVIKSNHICLFSYQNVFMDISSYIYKAACIFGTQNPQWIASILQIFLTLKENKVNVIPIFDGKPPDAKKDEIIDRKEKRNKLKDKISTILSIIEKSELKQPLDDDELSFVKDILDSLDKKSSQTQLKKLLVFGSGTESYNNSSTINKLSSSNINDLQNYIGTLQRQLFYISEKEIDIVKSLLDVLGIKHQTAPEEAEAYCCSMVRKGLANTVISCDTDCFTHGAGCVITNFDHNSGSVTYIVLKELLEELELTELEFIDFSILIGCDYNKKNKLPKVGPVKALELIKKYKTIEQIQGYDISNVNQVEIRKLFRPEYELIEEYVESEIDEDALYNFIDEYNIRISKDRLKTILKKIQEKPTIVWE
jgi:5'-3' exonuclease